jgi:NAD(P)-dependent dehydrogenase (short-subunit alcohol dehydrogenase family)
MTQSQQSFVIIGGTSGIGRAVAEAAHANGAAVTVVGRDAATAERTAAQIGAGVRGLAVDLTDADTVADLAGQVGALDHLVLSAASLSYAPFLDLPLAQARQVMETKFWGYYVAVRAFAPAIKAGGSITLFSGVAAARPAPGTVMVTAVNAAIEGLTRSLALELAPVRVNAVSPGVVATPGWAHLSEQERTSMFDDLGRSLPAGRVGQPEDVARAVLELTGNGYTTGEIRNVDGGALLV